VVNGDGLGYLKAATAGGRYPGHLAYVPLLALFAGARPVDGLVAARVVSAVAAAACVLALGGAARRLGGSAAVAAGGLAASWGMIAAGSDVESYAPAMAFLCAATYALARRRSDGGPAWSVAAALATAGAALFHVENVLFAAPLALALPRRERALAVAIAGAVVAGAYAAAGAGPGGASHGFRYPLRAATPFIALYGLCKALVYAPYPYEASWARVIGCFSVGALGLIGLVGCARRAAAPLGRAAAWAWIAPYSAVGIAFFASDAERWVFLLPLGWLTVACAPVEKRRPALAIAGALAVANLALWLPRARDASWRERARAAAAVAADGDLVISPGHGWDEYIGFYEGPAVEPFPLVFHAARLGGATPLGGEVAAAVARARARGRGVLLVRLVDDGDPLGWKELRPFGVTPATVAALLPAGRRIRLGDGVERLDPP
jgi:hypothetical protein